MNNLFRIVFFDGHNFYPMKNLSKREVMDFLSTRLDDLYNGGIIIQLEEDLNDEV